jgi:hypothetical protein
MSGEHGRLTYALLFPVGFEQFVATEVVGPLPCVILRGITGPADLVAQLPADLFVRYNVVHGIVGHRRFDDM